MTLKEFKVVMLMIGVLSWIPLVIAAFFLSPQPMYIKLSIGAAASFIAMLILFIKMDG